MKLRVQAMRLAEICDGQQAPETRRQTIPKPHASQEYDASVNMLRFSNQLIRRRYDTIPLIY